MEAVKQGSACVGLKSKTHAVIVALKRAPSELSAYQKKVIPIDDHCGVAVAGLTADARLLWYLLFQFIKLEVLDYQAVFYILQCFIFCDLRRHWFRIPARVVLLQTMLFFVILNLN